MKVTGAKIYLVAVGRLHPVLVEILTDEGITGVGEAAIAYGIGATAAAGMTKDLVEAIVLGKDPFRIEQLWADMYDNSFWRAGAPSSSRESARSSRRCGTSREKPSASRSTSSWAANAATGCAPMPTAGRMRAALRTNMPKRPSARSATATPR